MDKAYLCDECSHVLCSLGVTLNGLYISLSLISFSVKCGSWMTGPQSWALAFTIGTEGEAGTKMTKQKSRMTFCSTLEVDW